MGLGLLWHKAPQTIRPASLCCPRACSGVNAYAELLVSVIADATQKTDCMAIILSPHNACHMHKAGKVRHPHAHGKRALMASFLC